MADIEGDRVPLLQIAALTIDCADPEVMGAFYSAALGAQVTSATRDLVFLQTEGLMLTFRRVADYKAPTWPAPDVPLQTHFEFLTDDPTEAVKELAQLGAVLADFQGESYPDLQVMLDPAGKPFCVIRRSAVPH